MTVRILHVDDEPDIREVVQLALGLDPAISVESCASGGDALMVAAHAPPDLILLDVMMPGMDGPATLARLRAQPATASIPVVFMTARAQERERAHFISLGAQAVIQKPFDPMTLAACVRSHVPAGGATAPRPGHLARLKEDAATLMRYRAALQESSNPAMIFAGIKALAAGLADASNGQGDGAIGKDAQALHNAAIARIEGMGSQEDFEQCLDMLLARILGTH